MVARGQVVRLPPRLSAPASTRRRSARTAPFAAVSTWAPAPRTGQHNSGRRFAWKPIMIEHGSYCDRAAPVQKSFALHVMMLVTRAPRGLLGPILPPAAGKLVALSAARS